MRSLKRKDLLSVLKFLLKNKLMNGGNVIDDDFKKFAVQTQIDNICKILGGEAKHYYVSDRTTKHEKIVIEFNHTNK